MDDSEELGGGVGVGTTETRLVAKLNAKANVG